MLAKDSFDLSPMRFPISGGAHRLATSPTAVILAAGRGSRMCHLTAETPKCLAEINGKTLLDHQIGALRASGINDIIVVAGYEDEQIAEAAGSRAAIIRNLDWESTNSLYSLSLCRDFIAGPCLVLNSDVLFDTSLIQLLLDSGGNTFAFDSASGHDDEHMKVELENGRLVQMSKLLDVTKSHGENVGVLHFCGRTIDLLFDAIDEAIDSCGRNAWLASAVERLAMKVPLYGVDISEQPWIEIDYPEDLQRAREVTWPAIDLLRANPWPQAEAARCVNGAM